MSEDFELHVHMPQPFHLQMVCLQFLASLGLLCMVMGIETTHDISTIELNYGVGGAVILRDGDVL